MVSPEQAWLYYSELRRTAQAMDESKIDMLASLRSEYSSRPFTEEEADPDPVNQFRSWFGEAIAAGVPEPTAMTLATASLEGRPSARIVLLKGLDERGFVFYTNYDSRKGADLAENPWAALVFFWVELHRQVRAEGAVELVSAAESDAYFRTRPRGSQLGAWASAQSHILADRAALEQRVRELAERFGDAEIPRPPFWGGYRLRPTVVEFWQGRPDRLHDRLRYRCAGSGGWILERLSP